MKPKRPFAAIVGGIKLSREIRVIEYLLEKVDILILGGRMISTFNRANGLPVGSSPVQEDMIDTAKSIIEKAKVRGVVLHLPVDVVIADQCAPDASCKVCFLYSFELCIISDECLGVWFHLHYYWVNFVNLDVIWCRL